MVASCAMMDPTHQCGPKFRGRGEVCMLTVAFYIAGMVSGNFAEYLRQYRAERRRLGFPSA